MIKDKKEISFDTAKIIEILQPPPEHRQKASLKQLAEEDGTQLKKVSNTDGGTYHGACPVCGGKDRFRIQAAGGTRFKDYCECNKCSLQGNSADYLQIVRGLSKSEACKLAGIDLKSSIRQPQKPTEPKQQVNRTLWSQQAATFLHKHSRQHEDSKGEAVLAEKGISLETAKDFNLRYNPVDEFINKEAWGILVADKESLKTVIPAGLIIPISNSNGQIVKLVVRREKPYNGNRYHLVSGSEWKQPLIAGNPALDHIFIIESFLDSIKLHQEAGDLAQFIAGGGTSWTPDQQMIQSLSSKQIHLSLDNRE